MVNKAGLKSCVSTNGVTVGTIPDVLSQVSAHCMIIKFYIVKFCNGKNMLNITYKIH